MKYLQYVQPTGNRQTYSNTNLVINDMEFRFEFEYLYLEEQTTGGDWSECLGTGYPSKFRFGSLPTIFVMYGGSNYNAPTNTVLDGEVIIDKTGLWCNGTKVINISSPSSSIPSNPLTIGGDYDYPGDALVKSNTKLGRLKVYHSDVLVADFRPANDNGTIGFYDEVGQVFYDSDGSQPWIAGPAISSISATASKSSLAATGETISIDVICENAWTVTGNTFLTLSSTGDTGSTTITATAPSYTGATDRTDTLTFADTVTGDIAELTIKQKKYSLGQPVYLGDSEVTELYLGSTAVTEAYLGDVQVFSSGPFVGLKLSPKTISFNQNVLSVNLKVKSSESWTMVVPAWVTASTLTGDTGETVVTLTTTAQTAATSGTIEVTTTNYSASASCEYSLGTPMLQIDGCAIITTQFNPYTAFTGNNNYLKVQIINEWTGNRSGGAYLFQTNPVVFAAERFRINDIPYASFGSSYGVSNGPENGGGLDHTWVIEINGSNVTTFIDGTQTQTTTYAGTIPSADLIFAGDAANNLHTNFYGMRFWGANDTLIADFAPDPSGGIIDKVSNVVYPKTGTGTTAYSLVINQ